MSDDAFKALGFYDPGEWLQVPTRFALGLGYDGAFFLAYLINIYRMRLRDGDDRKGWVRMPTKTIRRAIPGCVRTIERRLRDFETLGIVQTRRRGVPATRWLRIDASALDDILATRVPDATTSDATVTPHLDAAVTPHLYKKKLLEEAVPRGTARASRAVREKERGETSRPRTSGTTTVRVRAIRLDHCREMASALHEMVSRVRAVPSSSRPQSWAQSFRTLVKRGVEVKRIRAVLRWYASVLRERGDLIRAGRQFVPIAYSGPRWLEKFDALEQAMYREGGAQESAAPGPKVRTVIVKATKGPARIVSGGTTYEEGF